MRILVIEDELPMRTALVETLQAEGYRVSSAADGLLGLEKACTEKFDLVLMDVMMPKLDGFALCRELRKRGRDMPVLMLTAKGSIDDRVAGLDGGADDYLVKPFSLRELLARVRVLLRRQDEKALGLEIVTIGEVEIRFSQRTLCRGDVVFDLSEKELGMLRLLTAYRGATVSREKFLDVVWGYNAYPTTRTVDNFITTLRAKLESDPKNPQHLLTVRGMGYCLM